MIKKTEIKYSSELPHPVDRELGSLIKERRREKGLSQQSLADSLKISYQQYQKYEKGNNRLSFKNGIKIARLLDISYEDYERAHDKGEAMVGNE